MPESASVRDPLRDKDAIVYELHVTTFFDANGGGVGPPRLARATGIGPRLYPSARRGDVRAAVGSPQYTVSTRYRRRSAWA